MTAAAPVLAALAGLSAAGWVDAAALALLVFAAVVGSVRGLTGELSRLFAFVAGLAVLSLSYRPILESAFPDEAEAGRIVSFALAVLAAGIGGALVRWGTKRFLKLLVGQPADGIAGAVLAAATTGIALLMVFSFLRLLPLQGLQTAVFETSVSGRAARPFVDRIVAHAMDRVRPAEPAAEPAPAAVAEPGAPAAE